jgi:hypothetical protein
VKPEDEKRYKEFCAAAEPLIKWLCDNVHPHYCVVVTPTGAELLEGAMAHKTTKHLKD